MCYPCQINCFLAFSVYSSIFVLTRFIQETIRAYWSKRRVETKLITIHGVSANLSISYLHHAKFQILRNFLVGRQINLRKELNPNSLRWLTRRLRIHVFLLVQLRLQVLSKNIVSYMHFKTRSQNSQRHLRHGGGVWTNSEKGLPLFSLPSK